MEQRGVVAAETISVLLTKPFLIVPCLRRRPPHHCGDPDPSRTIGQTFADFSNHLALKVWKVNKHGAFTIPRKSFGLCPTDQSCHHETWLHLYFADWSNTWSKQIAYKPRISLKELPAECSYWNPKRRISEIMSDHSLSS